MQPKWIPIISAIHGKRTRDGKISEPDIYWILDKWLERHPTIKNRQEDIRIVCGQYGTADGLRTEVITVSIVAGDDLVDYDPADDEELYEYFKAEERYFTDG